MITLLGEHFVDLLLVWPQPRGKHKPFDPDTRVAIAIARMAHLTVMMMTKTLALGKVPDAPLTNAIQGPIRMYGLQMHVLGLAGFDQLRLRRSARRHLEERITVMTAHADRFPFSIVMSRNTQHT
jgi:hypothetical protein